MYLFIYLFIYFLVFPHTISVLLSTPDLCASRQIFKFWKSLYQI